MKIEGTNYTGALDALEIWKEKMQEQELMEKNDNSGADTYVTAPSTTDMPIPSCSYNASGTFIS